MKRKTVSLLGILALLAGALALAVPALALGPENSIVIRGGVADTCSMTAGGGNLYIPTENNIVGYGSNTASMTVPGFGQVGFYQEDQPYASVSEGTSYGLPIIATFSVPANTVITLNITTYNEESQSGGKHYSSTATYDCTTGDLISVHNVEYSSTSEDDEPVPGCDVLINIPSGAVGATIGSDTLAYWAPGQATSTVLRAGTNVRAIAKDKSGEYYEILFACNFLFVPVGTIGPNYESPWNGAPLP